MPLSQKHALIGLVGLGLAGAGAGALYASRSRKPMYEPGLSLTTRQDDMLAATHATVRAANTKIRAKELQALARQYALTAKNSGSVSEAGAEARAAAAAKQLANQAQYQGIPLSSVQKAVKAAASYGDEAVADFPAFRAIMKREGGQEFAGKVARHLRRARGGWFRR